MFLFKKLIFIKKSFFIINLHFGSRSSRSLRNDSYQDAGDESQDKRIQKLEMELLEQKKRSEMYAILYFPRPVIRL